MEKGINIRVGGNLGYKEKIAGVKVEDRERKRFSSKERIEMERWGTPEQAYETWKSRTIAFIKIAYNYIKSLEAESGQAMQSYGNKQFYLYKPSFTELHEKREITSSILVSDLSCSYLYKFRKEDIYGIIKDEQLIQLDQEIITPNGKGFLKPYNREDLEEILHEIFEPLIATERIIEWHSPALLWTLVFNELGEMLKEIPHDYSFTCTYNGSGLEDTQTNIKFNDLNVTIYNPFYQEKVKEIARSVFILNTSKKYPASYPKPYDFQH